MIFEEIKSFIKRDELCDGNIWDSCNIYSDNVDSLVLQGIDNILKNGEEISVSSGRALQSYDVSYVLTNPLNRSHPLRDPASTKYLCRELLAYFNGSLKVDNLAKASNFWLKLADENNMISSNYGYYIFHQKVSCKIKKDLNQYEWCIRQLTKKPTLRSRQILLNINSIQHKSNLKDFPCTLGVQFYVRSWKDKDYLCCDVRSRSTDVITGLPYDMGFFSLVHELVWNNLKELGHEVKLGPTKMKATFTQIYSKDIKKVKKILAEKSEPKIKKMPSIKSSEVFLNDIYNKKKESDLMKWIWENAELN